MHFIFRTFILIWFIWISWHSPYFWWNVYPLKPKTFPLLNPTSKCSAWCLMGPICSTCVHSQIHLHYMCKIYSRFNRSSPLTTFPRLLNCWPPKPPPPQMPPWVIVGRIVFSLCPFPDESTDVYRLWCQSVHPFGSFPRLKIRDPLNPAPPPPKCPMCYWRANCI